MKAQGTQVLGQILERLSEGDVSYDDRKEVYTVLLEVFEDFDAKNLDECLDNDKAFDEVWNEKYPPELDEVYEDE